MKDYRSEYKGKCLTCKIYDISSKDDSTKRGYRCVHHHRPMAFDESCCNYSFDGARSNEMIDDAVSWRTKREYDPKRDKDYWYIVTVICYFTETPKMREYVENSREFRAVLADYPNGQRYLFYYDVYGYKLANCLLQDAETAYYTNDRDFYDLMSTLLKMLDSYNNQINYGNYPGALKKYLKIVYFLADHYNIEIEHLEIDRDLFTDVPKELGLDAEDRIINPFDLGIRRERKKVNNPEKGTNKLFV